MAIASETKTIVGVFSSVNDAQNAVRELEGLGIDRSDISIVANKNAAGYDTLDKSDKASDVVADAGIGAAIGGVGGLLLSAVGAITIPVIGPILAAGPIAAALTGAGIGAAAGGLVGALTESGIPEEHARTYAEGVRRGDVLVTVKADSRRSDEVCDILDRNAAVDVDERVSNWQSRGWQGYNESANPYTEEELRAERQYYQSNSSIGTSVDRGSGFDRDTTRTGDFNSMAGYDRDLSSDRSDSDRSMTGSGSDRSVDRPGIGDDLQRAGDRAGNAIKNVGHKIANTGRELRDEARETSHDMRDNMRDDTHDLRDDVRGNDDYARRRRSRVYDHVKY